jgi:hypothetical protein
MPWASSALICLAYGHVLPPPAEISRHEHAATTAPGATLTRTGAMLFPADQSARRTRSDAASAARGPTTSTGRAQSDRTVPFAATVVGWLEYRCSAARLDD